MRNLLTRRHRRLLCLLGLAAAGPTAAQPAPVPPPIEQLRADCARPQYASDLLVCGDPALMAADAEVAALAAVAPALAPDAIWEDQATWFRRRSRCAFLADHRACLVDAHADRRAVLMATGAASDRPLRCDGGWRGRRLLSSAVVTGQPIVIRQNGAVLAIATLTTAYWQPALAWQAKARGIRLRTPDGRQFDCRPTPA